eukprot:TRINITY_DN65898_c0_g1_i1.p1 TRINITY_DN65898_c0_g1~~TRINITY_DN65898_c0_g1_i1.p1  ORF type:complete len:842 (+),score=251.08 TRINITY_DN65898_c0_g1_i1:281-2806(+)
MRLPSLGGVAGGAYIAAPRQPQPLSARGRSGRSGCSGGAAAAARTPRGDGGFGTPRLPELKAPVNASEALREADLEVALALQMVNAAAFRGGAGDGSSGNAAAGSEQPALPLELRLLAPHLPDAPAEFSAAAAAVRAAAAGPRATTACREGWSSASTYDVTRVICRGTGVEEELASRQEDAREFARFRRSTAADWGSRSRRLAADRRRRRQLQQKRLRQLQAQEKEGGHGSGAGLGGAGDPDSTPSRRDSNLPSGSHGDDEEDAFGALASDEQDNFGVLVMETLMTQGQEGGTVDSGSTQTGEPLTSDVQKPLDSISERSETSPKEVQKRSSRMFFGHLNHSVDKTHRIKGVSKARKHNDRMQRLLEVRKLELASKPQAEQEMLHKAFKKGDVNSNGILDASELRKSCLEMGLKPQTDLENKEFQSVCQECMIAGGVDFFTFCFEAIPRLRKKLAEMRREPLKRRFSAYDADGSGFLSLVECDVIMSKLCAKNIDSEGMVELRTAFASAYDTLKDPEEGEVGFDAFEELITIAQEHYQRVVAQRGEVIFKSEKLEALDLQAHGDELVSLYDSFLRAIRNGKKGISHRELGRLLMELGEFPQERRGQEALQRYWNVQQLCAEPASALGEDAKERGIEFRMSFQEFLALLRILRHNRRELRAEELRLLFDRLDRDKSGSLELAEVFVLIGQLGMSPSCREDQMEMQQLLNEIDADESGEFNFAEFRTLVERLEQRARLAQLYVERTSAAALGFSDQDLLSLREAYFVFGMAHVGIPFESLQAMVMRAGIGVNRDQMQDIFQDVDNEGKRDGLLDFMQFLRFAKTVEIDVSGVQQLVERTADVG